MRSLPAYGDVLGYVVWFIDPVGNFQRFTIPTTDRDQAVEDLQWYSANGATCFMAEIRMVSNA